MSASAGKVLVTGGTGFIGRRLVERLLQQGQQVRLLVRPTSLQKGLLPEGVDVAWGDVTDERAVREAMCGCLRVFHLAVLPKPWARDPGEFAAVNVSGTRHVMAAALDEGVERVVHTSSMVTFGPTDGTVADEEQARSHPHFHSHYEHTKWLAEFEVRGFVEKGLSAVIVNPTVVLGPAYPLPRGLRGRSYRFLSGGIPGAVGSRIGRPGRLSNLVYIDDVVEGHLLAMDRGRTGEKYILGGDNVSSQDYLKLAQEISSLPLGRLRLPVGFLEMLGQVEEARARLWGGPPLITHSMSAYRHDWAFSCRKAQEELGYRYRGFRQAVQGMMGLQGGTVEAYAARAE